MAKEVVPVVGDVFAIPLPTEGYGFGRLIYVSGRWRIAEFFNFRSDKAACTPGLLESEHVLPVHCITTDAIESGLWPIVHQEPGFKLDRPEALQFYKGLPGARQRVWLDERSEPISDAEARNLASSMPQFA